MKKTKLILVVILFLGASFIQKVNLDTNAKLKAVFIYNFIRYIEWPKEKQKGYFTIGVLGESNLLIELNNMAKTKKIGTQPILIKTISSINEISTCHLLFITKKKSEEFELNYNKIATSNTLIVAEKEGMINKGVGINFVIRNNKQKFELNKQNIENQKLKVSSILEVLATNVQ